MDRVVGAMLGLACGDALGAPIEFMDQLTVRRRYGKLTGMIGGGPWQAGEWTDDTGTTLCVAEGILEDANDPLPAVGRRLLAWSESAKVAGPTVSAALANYRHGGDWVQASRTTPQAKAGRATGNGSLMRSLPVALAYAESAKLLVESARLSALTHWDSQAEVCAAVYCLWVRGLVEGSSVESAWAAALSGARHMAAVGSLSPETPGPVPLPDSFWRRLEGVTTRRYEDLQSSGYAGYCVECLEAAAWCCLNAEGAEDAILDAVNLAGVSDTIGALAGGAAGARWGTGALPDRWLEKLAERERIEKTGHDLARLRASLGG